MNNKNTSNRHYRRHLLMDILRCFTWSSTSEEAKSNLYRTNFDPSSIIITSNYYRHDVYTDNFHAINNTCRQQEQPTIHIVRLIPWGSYSAQYWIDSAFLSLSLSIESLLFLRSNYHPSSSLYHRLHPHRHPTRPHTSTESCSATFARFATAT